MFMFMFGQNVYCSLDKISCTLEVSIPVGGSVAVPLTRTFLLSYISVTLLCLFCFSFPGLFLCSSNIKIIQPCFNTVTRQLVGVQGKRTVTGTITCFRACMFHFSFYFFGWGGVNVILLVTVSCILITYIVIQLEKKHFWTILEAVFPLHLNIVV